MLSLQEAFISKKTKTMYILLYGIIIIFSTFMGAFVGLGGGVIIKPMLDLIGHDTVAAVNFISACRFQHEHQFHHKAHKNKNKNRF